MLLDGSEAVETISPQRLYANRETLHGTGVLPSEKKLQERAARFGVTQTTSKLLTEETLEKLYDR